MKKSLLLLVAGLFFPVLCLAAPHQFEIEPYVWGHQIDGQFGAGGLGPVNLDMSGTDLSPGFSGRAAYLLPSGWGFMLSGYQSASEKSGTSPYPEFPAGLVDASMGRLLMAPQWELPLESDTTARVWAGAQVSFFSLDVRLTRADFTYVTSGDDRTWWDPVLGGEVRQMLSEKWFVHGSGGWGGFGVNSQLTLSLMGAVGYQFDPLFSLKLGYRYEANDYSKDGLLLDGAHQGIILGLQFNI